MRYFITIINFNRLTTHLKHTQDKNGSNGPASLWQKVAIITLGIKIIWIFILEDVNGQVINISSFFLIFIVAYHWGHIQSLNLHLTKKSWSIGTILILNVLWYFLIILFNHTVIPRFCLFFVYFFVYFLFTFSCIAPRHCFAHRCLAWFPPHREGPLQGGRLCHLPKRGWEIH